MGVRLPPFAPIIQEPTLESALFPRLNPSNETLALAHVAQKGTAGGKEVSTRSIPDGFPEDGRRAIEEVRPRRRALSGAGGEPTAIQMAGSAGADRRRRGTTCKLPRPCTAATSHAIEARGGGQDRRDTGGEFFQRCLARNRGSTPEQKQVWRDGIYEQIREVMPMQGSLSIERMLFHQLNWARRGKRGGQQLAGWIKPFGQSAFLPGRE